MPVSRYLVKSKHVDVHIRSRLLSNDNEKRDTRYHVKSERVDVEIRSNLLLDDNEI